MSKKLLHKKIKAGDKQRPYFALLCDTSKWEPKSVAKKYPPLICGVFSTRQEARECFREIADCVADHRIVECKVTIEIV